MPLIPRLPSKAKLPRVLNASAILVVVLMGTSFEAQADDLPMPSEVTDADMACASITAYALMHSELEIQPLLKRCSENAKKRVCEITLGFMTDADNGKGKTYGLTCIGKP